MANVILSVPHAVCRDEADKIQHVCDVVSEKVARRLFDLLTDKGHKVFLRIADLNREEVDFNRPEGRESNFRKRLAKDFSRADFLFDVHSFPGLKSHWEQDIILLKWNNADDNREHVWNLLDRLARLDLEVGTAHAAKENDIVAHSLSEGLPAILAEFSERNVAERERKVVERVAEALDGFLEELPKRVSERRVSGLLGRLEA